MRRRLAAAALAAVVVLGCGASGTASPVPPPKLPDAVGNVALHLRTAEPGYYASPPPGAAWVTILGTLGRKWSDLSWVGSATDTAGGAEPKVAVYATQVRDVTASQLLDAYERWLRGAQPKSTIERTTIAGRPAIRVTAAGSPRVLLAYAASNTLFEISAPDEATAESILATLP